MTRPVAPTSPTEGRRAVRDSLIVTLGGQVERALGTITALMLRWGLDPAQLGVYTGLRLYLDNTNRSSLGVSLGAVQEIPILRARGLEDEARRVADIAHTTNTLTCLAYSLGLLIWAFVRAPLVANDPRADEWTWGLVAVAGLALLKRYESFLIAVLRAYQEFELTTALDIFESLVSIVAVGLGLWLAGFWGLLASVGLILSAKVAFLHARHPLRFRWAWDTPTAARLMKVGLPILANTAAFGAVLNLDRALILWRVPDGDRAAGLYTIAIMGTSWSLDLAGRIVTVMYTYFQSTLGRTRDPAEVARQAIRATEAQAPLLASGCAVAYLVGPVFLGSLMPHYVEGLPALRPLLARDAPARTGLARQADADRDRQDLTRWRWPRSPASAVTAIAGDDRGRPRGDRRGRLGHDDRLRRRRLVHREPPPAFPSLGWRPVVGPPGEARPDPGRLRSAGRSLAAHRPDRLEHRPPARVRRPLPAPRRLARADALDLGTAARAGAGSGSRGFAGR